MVTDFFCSIVLLILTQITYQMLSINRFLILLCTIGLSVTSVNAQLSTNKYKFLGNITTRGSVNGGGGVEYSTLWDQLTPENETKWASIEGTRDNYNA